jgi:hypothetical protein
MTHPRDQWFVLYAYEAGVAGPIVDPKTKAVSVGWITPPKWDRESDVAHSHHPDSYHPDVRVRIAHHREMLRRGLALSACGDVQDPRLRFIEEEKPAKRCAKCVAAAEAAEKDHAVALADLERKAAEAIASKKPPTEADFDQEEIPTGH